MIYNINLILILVEIILFKTVKYPKKNVSRSSNIKLGEKASGEFVTYNGERFRKKREITFLSLTFIQLAAIVCLRGSTVGTDTKTYLNIYHYICNGMAIENINYLEPGSRFLIWLTSLPGRSDVLFLSVFALPTIALNYRFIKKYSSDVYCSVFIFAGFMFYFLMFNSMRQSLAMAIALQAIESAMERKWVKFLIIIFIAASFHSSAWIFLFVGVLSFLKTKINIGYFACVAILCTLTFPLGNWFVSLMTTLFGKQYAQYLDSDFGGIGNILNPIMYLTIVFILSMFWEKRKAITDYFMMNMLAIGTILFFLSVQVQIANRLPYYFTSAIMILLPKLIVSYSNRKSYRLIQWGCYFAIALYEVLLVARNAHGILPYYFFWEQ